MTEMLRRMRKLRLGQKEKLTVIKQKTERRDEIRMEKAAKRANIQDSIEKELLARLKQGTYSRLYDDLFNLNKKTFD